MPLSAPSLRAVTPVAGKLDARLTSEDAQEAARDALASIAHKGDVGDFVGAAMEGERLASLAFVCLSKGYRGWFWVVTLSRLSRSRHITVCETELLPGVDALLSPAWVAWSDRLQPGDLGPGDILPFQELDPRLEQGFEATGEDADNVGVFELGLGRPRVLSREGRDEAATRWYAGDGGPNAPIAQRAKAHCSTCGFLIPMAGSLRQLFGVCANEWSPSDGKVVSYDHGCGAHSETDIKARPSIWPERRAMIAESVAFDDVDVVQLDRPAAPSGEAAVEAAPEAAVEPVVEVAEVAVEAAPEAVVEPVVEVAEAAPEAVVEPAADAASEPVAEGSDPTD